MSTGFALSQPLGRSVLPRVDGKVNNLEMIIGETYINKKILIDRVDEMLSHFLTSTYAKRKFCHDGLKL